MALPATDNFNRGPAGTGGANWTDQFGGITIPVTNTIKGTTAGDYNLALWNADVFSNDQYSQAKYLGGAFAGVGVRHSGSAGSRNAYYLLCNQAGATRLTKVVAGTLTDLIAPGSVPDPATNDIIKISVVGTLITVYINGVSQGSANDSSLTSGSAGVLFYDTNAELDDWEGGNAGGGAVLTGTAIGGITEADVVAGGKVITVTLTGNAWIAN
jgi:hypothetical protein